MKELLELFFPANLYKSLSTGKLHTEDKSRGIYLVVFRVPKKNPNQIIYKCFYYPDIFVSTMLLYLSTKYDFHKSFLFRHWGDFLTVIDKDLGLQSKHIAEHIGSNKYNRHLQRFAAYNKHVDIFSNDMVVMFDLIKKSILSVNNISYVIDLAVKKNYNNFVDLFFEINNINMNMSKDIYIIEKCLFAIKDLEQLITELRSLGYEVNKGPKSQLQYSTSPGAFLDYVDGDYRDFLFFIHNCYIEKGYYNRKLLLSRSKFNYDNIHKNIIGEIKL